MTVDKLTARKIAQGYVDAYLRVDPDGPDPVIIEDRVFESETTWAFVYNDRRYLETGEVRWALAGNGPIFVSKLDGAISTGGSARSVEEQLTDRHPGKLVTEPPPDPGLGATLRRLRSAVRRYADDDRVE